MQTPLLVLLLLTVSHLAAAAAVQQLWTSCDQASNVEPNASLYEAINCSYPDRFITITLKKPASVTLRNGSVKSGRGFTFTTTLPSMPAGPIAITVSNLLFGPNAVLTFDGPLPNSSMINFSGNRFALTDSYSFSSGSVYRGFEGINLGAYGLMPKVAILAVIVKVYGQPLENATIEVANTTVTAAVSRASSFVAVALLRLFQPVVNSTVNLYNNTLRDTKANDAATVVWQFGELLTSVVVSIKNSNVVLTNNSFINSTVSGVGSAVYWYILGFAKGSSATCSLSFSVVNSHLALTGNRMERTQVDNDGIVAYWLTYCATESDTNSVMGQKLLVTNSTFSFCGNLLSNSVIKGSANVAYVESRSRGHTSTTLGSGPGTFAYSHVSNLASFYNESSLLLNDNVMVNTSVTGSAVVAQWFIFCNALSYSEGGGGNCLADLDVAIDTSTVGFSGNVISNTTVGGPLKVAYWYIYSFGGYNGAAQLLYNSHDVVVFRGTLTFSGNQLVNTSGATDFAVIHWIGKSENGQASPTTGSTSYSLGGNSTLSFNDNSAMQSSCSTGMVLVSVQVPQKGWDRISVLIDWNQISTVRAASVTVLLFLLSQAGSMKLLSFSHNVFTEIEVAFAPIVLTSLSVNGSIFINSNQFRISSGLSSTSPLVSFGSVSSALSVEVVRNFIQANVTNQLLHFQSISVSEGGQVLISRNVVNANKVSNSLIAVSQLRLAGSASLFVHLSRIGFVVSDFNTSGYRLLPANLVNISGEAMALICNNIVFGRIQQPEDLFSRPELAAKVVKVCSQSPSATITPSGSLTVKALATASTHTMSDLSTATISSSATPSNSANATNTLSLASTASTTSSTSESRSDTQSESESQTASSSPTKSISVSITQTLTGLMSRPSPSLSETLTCKDLEGLNENETCSVLRPLPSDWKQELYTQWVADTRPADSAAPTLAAYWLYGNSSDCTTIQVPFTVWRGRQGSIHSIGIVAIDPRVPFHAKVESTPVGGESNNKISLDAVGLVDLPISLMDNKSAITTHNKTFQTVVATFRYGASPTMNRIRYQFNCRDFLKCPISMPGDMFVTLVEAERLLPVAVAEAVAVGTAVAVAIGGITVSPTSIVQLGVITSLRSMSRCVSYAVDGEDAMDDYSDYTEGVLNPFGVALGSIDVRGYLRGTIVTSIAYTAVGCLLMTLLHVLAAQLVGRKTAGRTLAGYPSAFIAVISFAMDGAASAGAILGTTAEGWGDGVLGWVSLAMCVAYVSHVLYVSKVAFPPTLRSISTTVENKSDDLNARVRLKAWLKQLTTRSHKWEGGDPTDLSAANWKLRYESYIDDTSVSWYCGLEQVVAVLVCMLAALPLGGMPFCITRGALCTLLLGGQAAVLFVKRAKVEPWRLLLLSVVLSFQTASALLSVVNVPLQDPKVELGMDALGVATFLLIACSTVVDFLSAARDAIAFAKKVKWRCDRRKRRRSPSTNHCKIVDDLDLQLIIPPQGQLTPPAELLDSEDDEAAIVRQILLNFAEYEQLQEYKLDSGLM